MLRHLVGLATSAVGTCAVLGSVVAMNAMDYRPPAAPEREAVAFDLSRPPPPPPQPRPRPKPRPRQAPKTPPVPIPTLAAGLSGLDLGFGGSAVDLGDATASLVGDARDVVMTADAVDEVPVPVERPAVAYPSSARARGITGAVTLSVLVGVDGAVHDVRVLQSQPAGVFDDAAMRAIRGWRFRPATYQGRPVQVRVEQTIRFDLER